MEFAEVIRPIVAKAIYSLRYRFFLIWPMYYLYLVG